MSSDDHLHSILIVSGVATALLGSSLAFVLLRRRKKVEEIVEEEIVEEEEVLDLNVSVGVV